MKIQTYNNRHYFIGFTKLDLDDLRRRKLQNITKIYIFMTPDKDENTRIRYSNSRTSINKNALLYLVNSAREGKYIINIYTMNLPGDYFNKFALYDILDDLHAYKDILKIHSESMYAAYINCRNLVRIHRTREALQYDIFKPYYDYRDANLLPDESMVIQSFCFYR